MSAHTKLGMTIAFFIQSTHITPKSKYFEFVICKKIIQALLTLIQEAGREVIFSILMEKIIHFLDGGIVVYS